MIPNHVLLLHSPKRLQYLSDQEMKEILRNKMRQYMKVDIVSDFKFEMFYCESNTHLITQVIDNTLSLQEQFRLPTFKKFLLTSFYWDYVEGCSDVKYLKRRLKKMHLEGFYLFIITSC